MNNWYKYDCIGDPMLPSSYSLADALPYFCGSGPIVCAIYLNDSSNQPSSIPWSVKNYLANGMATLVAQPENYFKFVYMKPE